MSDTPQLHKPAAPATIIETGEALLDLGVKGIVQQVTYEREGDAIRVLRPHGKSIGAHEVYACQGAYVPQETHGLIPAALVGRPVVFWFRIPAGSIEQAFARAGEALALAGAAFEERFWARAREKAKQIRVAHKEPPFRRGPGDNGDRL